MLLAGYYVPVLCMPFANSRRLACIIFPPCSNRPRISQPAHELGRKLSFLFRSSEQFLIDPFELCHQLLLNLQQRFDLLSRQTKKLRRNQCRFLRFPVEVGTSLGHRAAPFSNWHCKTGRLPMPPADRPSPSL